MQHTWFFKVLFYENHNRYLVSSHDRRSLNAMPVLKIEIDKQHITVELQPQQFYVNTGTIVNMSF